MPCQSRSLITHGSRLSPSLCRQIQNECEPGSEETEGRGEARELTSGICILLEELIELTPQVRDLRLDDQEAILIEILEHDRVTRRLVELQDELLDRRITKSAQSAPSVNNSCNVRHPKKKKGYLVLTILRARPFALVA